MPATPTQPERRRLAPPRARRARRAYRGTIRPLWRELRPVLVVLSGLAVVVLGTIGYHRLPQHYGFFDALYRSIGLFGLGGAVDPPVPLTLQIARILGPIITGYAAVRGLLAVSREQIELLGIRLLIRDHVVVAGLSATGTRLATRFHDAGFRVVVIEKDAAHAAIPGLRERGISVVRGSAADTSILRKARAGQARHLFVTCGDDGVNVDIAVAAGSIVPAHRRGVLGVVVHLDDLALWSMLSAEAIARTAESAFRLEFFNVFATGARLLLERHPPFGPRGAEPRRPHVLQVGTEGAGEQLVLHVAGLWLASEPGPDEALRITLTGPAAHEDLARLREREPDLDRVCTIEAHEADLSSARFRRGEVMLDAQGACDVSAAYVALVGESEALAAALALHAMPQARAVPVVVAVADEQTGVANALRAEGGAFTGIEPFGVIGAALSPALLLGGTTEVLARAKHDEYVRNQQAAGRTPADNPSMRSWEELPEALKESNRRFADGIGPKLEAAGAVIVPSPLLGDHDGGFAFTEAEVEDLARQEHDRWAGDLVRDGWRPTTGPKDPERKLHPLIVGWEELDEAERDKDRQPVREIPAMVARAGFRIYRPDAAADRISST